MKPDTTKIAIRRISSLLTMVPAQGSLVGLMSDAAVIVSNGRIEWVGSDKDCPQVSGKSIDATGLVVMPGLIDCHTHLVFAGDRVGDFYARAKGDTYAQIMARGGGIQQSVSQTRKATQSELVALALPRLRAIAARGITTLEIKSGYGLTFDDELKILKAVKQLNAEQSVMLVPTFMGAHAIAPEFNGDSAAYTDFLIAQVLPEVAHDQLAAGVDVFIEKGAFTVDDARRLLLKARELGLNTKIHADQLTHSGGTRLAAELKVNSVSHLEHATDAELAALAQTGVIAEVLPLSELYLGMRDVVDARRLCDLGVKVAIGTDFNPGSAMCDDLLLAMRLSITHRKLSVEEAYLGVTHHAACALGLQNEIGQIKVGMKADLRSFKGPSPWSLAFDWTLEAENPAALYTSVS